ncbi:hypothetical protein A1O1_06344 [Capronia coronata CBS 617.96]|uniref:HMG box domain-containing protein n=1 Tax=Capronia coronata CBS 617.96 TaxID=1182541 RepID=W9Y8M0_9EURO|nr:uncharacterized protein A1O1_06344 [Capronia coronata CBS 617.96]EXJ85975.1 hypothetical protein A1O1_06344 [Capronia coronata CBS 617.96]
MTATLPYSRTLSKQLVGRGTWLFTRPAANSPLLRVSCNCTRSGERPYSRRTYLNRVSGYKHARTYATATEKPASRPKSHTGRDPPKRRATTLTKEAKPAKKTTKKPKKKAVKKAKPKGRKPLSKTAILQKQRQDAADLRAAALLQEPKQLPQTAFTLVFVEEAKKGGDVKSNAGEASARYRNLSPEEREQYNHQANLNKEKNIEAYKRWVQSFTPLEIKKANNARKLLAKKAKAAGKKTKFLSIKDDRSVKAPQNAYSFFFTDRHKSGDLKGMSVGESGKLVGKEWKSLSPSEKKPYEDKAAADAARYEEEYKTVYGVDSPRSRKRTS